MTRFFEDSSIDLARAVTFPALNPVAPLRWITSKKKVSSSKTGSVKICNKYLKWNILELILGIYWKATASKEQH